jgi:hypothetical protein
MTDITLLEMLRCASILRCLKSKYLLFFPSRRVFRHVGMDVNEGELEKESIILDQCTEGLVKSNKESLESADAAREVVSTSHL